MSAGQRDEPRCQSAFWGGRRGTVAAALVAGLLSGLPTSVWVLVHGDGAFWGWDAALAVASQFVDRWGLQVLYLPTFVLVQAGMWLLGLSGMVISLRQPRRLGWLVCAHICLLEYYWISVALADGILGSIAC